MKLFLNGLTLNFQKDFEYTFHFVSMAFLPTKLGAFFQTKLLWERHPWERPLVDPGYECADCLTSEAAFQLAQRITRDPAHLTLLTSPSMPPLPSTLTTWEFEGRWTGTEAEAVASLRYIRSLAKAKRFVREVVGGTHTFF